MMKRFSSSVKTPPLPATLRLKGGVTMDASP